MHTQAKAEKKNLDFNLLIKLKSKDICSCYFSDSVTATKADSKVSEYEKCHFWAKEIPNFSKKELLLFYDNCYLSVDLLVPSITRLHFTFPKQ